MPRGGLYSSQHKNIHPSASHYYALFVFGKRNANSPNIIRLLYSPSVYACHFQFSLLRPNFPSPIKLLRNNKTNPSNSIAEPTNAPKAKSNTYIYARAHQHTHVNIILRLQPISAIGSNWSHCCGRALGDAECEYKMFESSHFASNFRMIAKQSLVERPLLIPQHSTRINHFRPRLLCRRSLAHTHT